MDFWNKKFMRVPIKLHASCVGGSMKSLESRRNLSTPLKSLSRAHAELACIL